MESKLPVIPFIETSHQNKTFFNQEFNPQMVGNILGRKPIQVSGFGESNETFNERYDKWIDEDSYRLFEGWVGKTKLGWVEMKSDNGDKLEFYKKTYKINTVELPYPQTLDHFITDCKRLGVSLWWDRNLIDLGINPYHLVTEDVAKEITYEMLTIMDKL